MIRVHIFVAAAAVGSGAASVHAQWMSEVLHPGGAWESKILSVTADRQVGYVTQSMGTPVYGATWSGTAGSWEKMESPSRMSTMVYATNGPDAGGHAATAGSFQAAVWIGNEFRDLNPGHADFSSVRAISRNSQGGYVGVNGTVHAALWHGDAGSFIDLHPLEPTAVQSEVTGVAEGQQVGSTKLGLVFSLMHASLWSGSAGSWVDLNPEGVSVSRATCTDGARQGGFIGVHGNHAGIWSGTGASFVDVHPVGMFHSEIHGISEHFAVGYVNVEYLGVDLARVWLGSGETSVDLHQFLPAGYVGSRATSVFETQDAVYVGGLAEPIEFGTLYEAVVWKLKKGCAADCDESGALDIFDFLCFQDAFVAGDPEACDCDTSTSAGVCDLFDFLCFQNRFVVGCG